MREVQPYIDRANHDGVKIKYILETHFHADFVSGHITLAENWRRYYLWAYCQNFFDAIIAEDNQEFKLGKVGH
ncbi:MAG: hypothetical protein R2728_04785 [Chitinophagales bacterium]